jgi:hypothetical protein
MQDTARAASERYFTLLREAGPQRRLEICVSLSNATRDLALAGIKAANPGRNLSTAELRHHLARRLYGSAVAERYFPHSGA